MFSIRGAVTIENDSPDDVYSNTGELFQRIIEVNKIDIKDIVSIIFTCTSDIKSVYPAKAVRDLGVIHAGLMCLQEMEVENSLKRCIRILVLVNGDKLQMDVNHVYLKEAIKLRPDILKDFDKKY